MMMALGMFVFGLRSVPYQALQRQLAWRHASTARVGLRPARQYLGKDDETITSPACCCRSSPAGRHRWPTWRQWATRARPGRCSTARATSTACT
nr:phage tail protein [Chitiniphilus shinanonensis]